MPHRSLLHVHAILLQMIQQDFPIPVQGKKSKPNDGKNHIWEVRHAGLLGIKYEVAVRNDLFDQDTIKQEKESGKSVLRGVVDAAILGCVDHNRTCY
jgi:TATA-binding protein-associated factor